VPQAIGVRITAQGNGINIVADAALKASIDRSAR